jgi:hypothetical protein
MRMRKNLSTLAPINEVHGRGTDKYAPHIRALSVRP